MENIQCVYGQNRKNLMMDCLPAPGTLVAAKLEKDYFTWCWHRAKVVEVEEYQIKICLVDIGSVIVVSVSQIRRLEPCFSVLPFQAILATLSDIECSTSYWSEKAISMFTDLVSTGIVSATVSEIIPNQPLYVDLNVKNNLYNSDFANVSEMLFKKGYAVKMEKRNIHDVCSSIKPG